MIPYYNNIRIIAIIVLVTCIGLCQNDNVSAGMSICSDNAITVIVDESRDNNVVIKTKYSYYDTGHIALERKENIIDARGNSYLFLILSNLGSGGSSGLLVTAAGDRLIYEDFGGPAGGWSLIKPNKIVFVQRWRDFCLLESCNACGVGYPIMWVVSNCIDNNILMKNYLNLSGLLEDADGRILVNALVGELKDNLDVDNIDNILTDIPNLEERSFCASIAKETDRDVAIKKIIDVEFKLGSRIYEYR